MSTLFHVFVQRLHPPVGLAARALELARRRLVGPQVLTQVRTLRERLHTNRTDEHRYAAAECWCDL